MTEHERLVLATLEARDKIVRNILYNNVCSPDARSYYEGKAEGYSQAITLLKENAESIAIELETRNK